jgi:photosystem II stability/assembly factor-like uncharacterized protein
MKIQVNAMRKVGLAGALAMGLAGGFAQAQEDAAAQDAQLATVRHGIPHDAIYDIEIMGKQGLAVGAFGTVLQSEDSGESWTPMESGTQFALLGIGVNGERRIVVGQRGTVLLAGADGKWEAGTSNSEARLMNVSVNAAGLAVAVGEFGTVLRSKDGGQNWEKLTLDWMSFREDGYEPHLYSVNVDETGRVVLGGEFSYVIVSEDGGDTWTLPNKGEKSIFSMFFMPDGSGYAVGQEGLVMKTPDMGNTWTTVEVGSNANLFGVWASKHGEVVITGQRALIRSSDGGNTWTPSTDVEIVRNWFQPIAVGESASKAPGGEMVAQVIYVGGYMGKIARLMR